MTTLKFGAALPYTTPRSVAQLAQLAEENGWEAVFMGDAIWCEDPMIGLAAAAMLTERIRLGMMVIPTPIRRPWKVASESGTLDRLSSGHPRPPVERAADPGPGDRGGMDGLAGFSG
jgi:alkanesulfonate monooxygenase SsuD/methylene tetrahydromethanopterin reductase-like flavin-dependent oxidoreductase (luciferase family)